MIGSMDNATIVWIGLGILLLVAVLGRPKTRRGYRTNARSKSRRNQTRSSQNNWGMTDPNNQLAAVQKVAFERVKIVNGSEYKVLQALESIIAEHDQGFRVMAQTSLGELVRPDPKQGDWKLRKDASASVNSKRLDFAIIDPAGYLAVAVEYQGAGHHGKDSAIRDAVKREAIERAGASLIEVEPGMKPAELRSRIISILSPEHKGSPANVIKIPDSN